MNIVIRDDEDTGEWIEVEVDGEIFFEGHSLPLYHTIALLRKAGASVELVAGYFDEDSGLWVAR